MATKGAPKFNFSASKDLKETYQLWKQRLLAFQKTGKVRNEDLQYFIQEALDDDGLRAFNSFGLTEEEQKVPDNIFKCFETRFNISKPNFRAARLDLHFFYQDPSDSIDDFFTKFKEKSIPCEFDPDAEKERFIEQLLASNSMGDFKKFLLGAPKTITLDEVLIEGRKWEVTTRNLKHLQGRDNQQQHQTSIDALRKKQSTCKRCGKNHGRRREDCPAVGSKCYKCGLIGHWSHCCLKSKHKPRNKSSDRNHKPQQRKPRSLSHHREQPNGKVNEIEEFEQLEYGTISLDNITQRNEAFVKINVKLPGKKPVNANGTQIQRTLRLKVDTGAQGNTLPLRVFQQMYPEQIASNGTPKADSKVIQPASTKLTAYNGTEIKTYGSITLKCKYNNSEFCDSKFYIVDVHGAAVIGLPLCETLGIVTVHCALEHVKAEDTSTSQNKIQDSAPTVECIEDLIDHFPDQFDKIGKLPGEARLFVAEGAIPFIDPPRKFPIHVRDKLQKELDQMEELGIIRKMEEHSDWCSSITTTIKADGSLRVCLDPRKLNNALRRCPHKMLTLEETSHKLFGAQYFSKLDAKAGYWSVQLAAESQVLTTFRTPLGRYCFLRLPFGLNVSQDIFQQKIDKILDKCPGTIGIADDIMVYGASEDEHAANLLNLMQQARANNLVFNSKKCQIKQKEVSFFGMRFSIDGMKPDEKKVMDLHNMPEPKSKKEVQVFLGLINYLSPFIRNLSAEAEPLRQLTKEQVPFEWSEDYSHIFSHLKSLVSKEVCLKFYDTEGPVSLMVDASTKGIGAALLQPDRVSDNQYGEDFKPVAFASKALTSAEKNYSNLEREMLAVVWGIKRFHTYLYGRQFTVITDHRPLEMICRKPVATAPQRLQTMLLSIQGYCYDVKYTPGKQIGLADTLSRLPTSDEEYADSMIDDSTAINLLQFRDQTLADIKDETRKSPVLNCLKDIVYVGWPDNIKDVPTQIRQYWSFRDEISVENGILFKGTRVIIPPVLQKNI